MQRARPEEPSVKRREMLWSQCGNKAEQLGRFAASLKSPWYSHSTKAVDRPSEFIWSQ